jgi:hypothetical protein
MEATATWVFERGHFPGSPLEGNYSLRSAYTANVTEIWKGGGKLSRFQLPFENLEGKIKQMRDFAGKKELNWTGWLLAYYTSKVFLLHYLLKSAIWRRLKLSQFIKVFKRKRIKEDGKPTISVSSAAYFRLKDLKSSTPSSSSSSLLLDGSSPLLRFAPWEVEGWSVAPSSSSSTSSLSSSASSGSAASKSLLMAMAWGSSLPIAMPGEGRAIGWTRYSVSSSWKHGKIPC